MSDNDLFQARQAVMDNSRDPEGPIVEVKKGDNGADEVDPPLIPARPFACAPTRMRNFRDFCPTLEYPHRWMWRVPITDAAGRHIVRVITE